MFRQHTLIVTAIVLILVSVACHFMPRGENRAGHTLVITDLVDGQEYLVISPIITSFTDMEVAAGIQRMLIVENKKNFDKEPVPAKSFTLSQSNVDKEDFGNLTFETIIIRKGDKIRLVPPKTEKVEKKIIAQSDGKNT